MINKIRMKTKIFYVEIVFSNMLLYYIIKSNMLLKQNTSQQHVAKSITTKNFYRKLLN